MKWLLFCFPFLCFANDQGNFSLPNATQPSPLISFGQLLIGKGAFFPQLSPSYTRGPESYTSLLSFEPVYGILDEFSIALFVPFTPISKSNHHHFSGFQDITVQCEYGFYTKNTNTYNTQATIVANAQIPTGVPAGTNSFAGFLGATYAYLSPYWYAFVSPGVNLGKSPNTSYLYQCGISRYIPSLSPPSWICNLMVEFDGTYTPSSGNLFLATPSINFASNLWLLQFGVSFPLTQHPTTTWYAINGNAGIVFQF